MNNTTYILGISMSNHDRSACLLKDGKIVSAISEERIDRRKRSEGFYGLQDRGIVLPPFSAITYVLNCGNITLDDIDLIVTGRSIVSCKATILRYLPVKEDKVIEIPIPGHHLAHAYSAYGTSPFENSAVMVIDEQGHHFENSYEKCSLFEGNEGKLITINQFKGNSQNISLGMFYDIFAGLVGLSEANRPSAGKLMGLAPYGKESKNWPSLITLKQNGDNMIYLPLIDEFFSKILETRSTWGNREVNEIDDLLVKYVPISWNSELGANLAYKAQVELEKAVLHLSNVLFEKTTSPYLSYAGGVALNCTTNSKLLQSGWEDVYVHPGATDDGVAIGLAMYGWIEFFNRARLPQKQFNVFTGIQYSKNEILQSLEKYELSEYIKEVSPSEEGAKRLLAQDIICWFQGQSEWGPRALGSRSIVANPLQNEIKKLINSRIKYRESFRPFGISGTNEGIENLLDLKSIPKSLTPYMLAVAKPNTPLLSEVEHVDKTIRFQIVNPEIQPEWHQLIKNFGDLTGVYAVLNTSFNVLGEPLVETPHDAVRQFLICGADVLILDNYQISIRDIPNDVLDYIISKSYMDSKLDFLQSSLSLFSSGYVEAAKQLLNRVNYKEEDALCKGSSMTRKYYFLLLNFNLHDQDYEQANYHAKKILEYSNLPYEASFAGNYLSQSGEKEDDTKLGQLISSISNSGQALKFFEKILQ